MKDETYLSGVYWSPNQSNEGEGCEKQGWDCWLHQLGTATKKKRKQQMINLGRSLTKNKSKMKNHCHSAGKTPLRLKLAQVTVWKSPRELQMLSTDPPGVGVVSAARIRANATKEVHPGVTCCSNSHQLVPPSAALYLPGTKTHTKWLNE